jgi:hypothetical protein
VNAFGYRDLFYTDDRPALDVRAKLTLLPETKNARRSSQQARWRPNHNFGPADGRDFYIGQVEFESVDTVEPGQTVEVLVRFFDGPGLREHLVPGRSWRVQEGPNLVATARVVSVADKT